MRARARVAAAITAASLAACGAEPPALQVGDVAYSSSEVLGLSHSRIETLRDLTALGVVVAREELAAVTGPLVDRLEADELWQRIQAEALLDEAGVTEENLQARYLTAPRYELTVRHLILLAERTDSEADRAAARDGAAAALERVQAGEPFPEVAAEVSQEPGAAERQGLLEPQREGGWVDEFWNAANALEVGEVSGVVETQYGFHVLRLEARDTIPFQEARDAVALETARLIGDLEPRASRAPLPPGFQAVDSLDSLEGESALAATFDGGEVKLGDLLDYAATMDVASWSAAQARDPEALGVILGSAVRAAWVREVAARQGIQVTPAWRAAREAEWIQQAQGWAQLLGFRPGMDGDGVKAAALSALGTTGQLMELTRQAVMQSRGLLQRHVGSEAP